MRRGAVSRAYEEDAMKSETRIQRHYCRTAAAGAVLAAIAAMASPVYAETYTGVTASIPESGSEMPYSVSVESTAAWVYGGETTIRTTGRVNGADGAGVYLPGSGSGITLEATHVSIDAWDEESDPVLIMSSPEMTAAFDSPSIPALVYPELYIEDSGSEANLRFYSSLTGTTDGGSISIGTGAAANPYGTISIYGGDILIANAADAVNPLTFTVNAEKTANYDVDINETNIVTSGPKTTALINLTGYSPTFSGSIQVLDGADFTLNARGRISGYSINVTGPTTDRPHLSGTVIASGGGTAEINATDAQDDQTYIARPGGTVRVNLQGASVQGTRFAYDTKTLVYGENSVFEENISEDSIAYMNLSGAGGSSSTVNVGGEWWGSAYLTTYLPSLDTSAQAEGGGTIPSALKGTTSASSLTVNVEGEWDGSAVVGQYVNLMHISNGQPLLPDFSERRDPKSPYYIPADTDQTAQVTVNVTGDWDGSAWAWDAGGRISVIVGNTGEWTGVVGATNGGRAEVTLGEPAEAVEPDTRPVWNGDAVIESRGTASLTINGNMRGDAMVSYRTESEDEAGSTVSGASDGVKSFVTDVSGNWTGILEGTRGSDSTVTIEEGGLWRYADYADFQPNSRLTAMAMISLTGGSHADVDMNGTLYGAASLAEDSALSLTIGKSGYWTYVRPDDDPSQGPIRFNPELPPGADFQTQPVPSGPITAEVKDGGSITLEVDGTWKGDARTRYLGTDEDGNTAGDPAALGTGKAAGVMSLDAAVNGTWIGSLEALGGSDSRVTVDQGGVWRYNTETQAETWVADTVMDTLFKDENNESYGGYLLGANLGAPAAAVASELSHVTIDIADGTLYGSAVAAGGAIDITVGEKGTWLEQYPDETPLSEFPRPITAVSEGLGSSLSVTLNGQWTGDAVEGDRGELAVTIGKNGVWQMSPDNKTVGEKLSGGAYEFFLLVPPVYNPGLWSRLYGKAAAGGEFEASDFPILAYVDTGSSFTLENAGDMTGSVFILGSYQDPLYPEDYDDNPVPTVTRTEFKGSVSGHWDGALFAANSVRWNASDLTGPLESSKSEVRIEPGGLWENHSEGIPDTITAQTGAEVRVTDYGTLRGTALAAGDGTSLAVNVGQGGVWAIGDGNRTGTAPAAYAVDQASLTVGVEAGGEFSGSVLAKGGAAAGVNNSGVWTGSAKADDAAVTLTDGGVWTGNVWASNSGTADVTVTGSWTGTVKDPGLDITYERIDFEDWDGTFPALTPADPAATPGTVAVSVTGPAAVWNMTESTAVDTLTLNSGTINFPAAPTDGTFSGSTLTVNEDFTGNGGTFAMNTVLLADDAATDKLVINGDASGTALMTFKNIGGTGAQTVDGIRVAEVEGNNTLTITKPAKNFLKAGAYVYQLQQKENSWYLTSQKQLVILPRTDDDDPTSGDEPTKGDTPAATELPDVIPATPGLSNHIVRPEIGAYANNLYAANTLFSMNLEERLGEVKYADAMRGKDGEKSGSFWIRAHGGHTRNGMEDGSLTTRGNWGVMQVGGDVISWPTSGDHRLHAGLMAGYAHESSRTTSPDAGYTSKGKVSGYSVGLYGTWMNEKADGTGPYADLWAQWQRFKNQVSSSVPETVSYHAKGFTVSLEGGYAFALKDWQSDDGTDNALRLQLQGQVIRMGVRDDSVRDAIGTSIVGLGAGNVRTRLGGKLYYQKTNDAKGRAFKPFLALNWYHDTKAFGAAFDGVADRIDGGRNTGEVKVGLEAKLRKNVNLWGSVAYEAGSESYRNVEALLGAKILF